MLPTTTIALDTTRRTAKKVLRLIDALEDHDDVQDVYANFDIPDDILTSISVWPYRGGVTAAAIYTRISKLGLLSAATVWAKPADLPSHNPIECHDSQEKTVEPDTPPVVDAFLPAFVKAWLQHAADVLARPEAW